MRSEGSKAVIPGIANDALELDGGVLLPMVEDCVRSVDLGRAPYPGRERLLRSR